MDDVTWWLRVTTVGPRCCDRTLALKNRKNTIGNHLFLLVGSKRGGIPKISIPGPSEVGAPGTKESDKLGSSFQFRWFFYPNKMSIVIKHFISCNFLINFSFSKFLYFKSSSPNCSISGDMHQKTMPVYSVYYPFIPVMICWLLLFLSNDWC